MTRKWMSHWRLLIGHTDTALASYWLVQTQSTGWLRSKLEAMRLRSLEQGPIVHFSFLSPIKIWLNSAKLQDTFLDRPPIAGPPQTPVTASAARSRPNEYYLQLASYPWHDVICEGNTVVTRAHSGVSGAVTSPDTIWQCTLHTQCPRCVDTGLLTTGALG